MIHPSFLGRVRCFYCDADLTQPERASKDLSCRSCFRALTVGKPRSRRRILDIYEVKVDLSRPAYQMIPLACYSALRRAGKTSFIRTKQNVLKDSCIARRILDDHTLEVYVTVSSEAEERREAAKSTK